jgi:hypothetical protein
MKLGTIETKKNAIERSGGGSGGLYDGMRHVLEADGSLGSYWTDGHSWRYIRKVWKSLKENHDNSLDR